MNILIIGLGSIAKKHLKVLREIQPNVIIYALRSSKDAENWPGVQNIHSLQEFKVKLDFIIISTPTHLHGEYILKSLSNECPIFIEKPVLNDLIYSEAILEELNRKKIISYVACNMRFHPALQFLKSFILTTNPLINEVNVYCGSFLPDWRPGRDFRTTYSANANMGGGVHLDLIHEIDYCSWLFGIPKAVNTMKRSVSSLHIDSFDYAHFSLEYPTFTTNITLNYYRRDIKRQIEIVTAEDTFMVDLVKSRIFSYQTGTILFEQDFDMSETYLKQMQYFINCLHFERQPMNDFAEGLDVLKIALHE